MKDPDDACIDCAAPYVQPFREPHLRFLWWLDDQLHRLHRFRCADVVLRLWPRKALCRYVDKLLCDGHVDEPAVDVRVLPGRVRNRT